VANSGQVHIWSQLIIPNHNFIFAVRGAQASGDISTSGIAWTGSPEWKGVVRGDLLAFDSPISSTMVTA